MEYLVMSDANFLAKSQILTSALGEGDVEWIPVAAIDQKAVMQTPAGGVTLNISEGALANNLESWKGGYININHTAGAKVKQFKIEDAKFEDGMLYHKVSKEAAEFIQQTASSGRSIEVRMSKIEGNKVTAYDGLGLSVLFPPYKPACNSEMGCSSLLDESKSTIDKIFSVLAEKIKSNSSNDEELGKELSQNSNSEVKNMEATDIMKLTSALAEAKSGQEDARKEILTLKSSLTEAETAVKSKEDLLKATSAKLETFEKAAEVAAAKLKEDQWAKIVSSIPAGKVHKPEDAEALKKEFMDDPAGFNLKLVSFLSEKPGSSRESGANFVQDAGSDEVEDFKLLALLEG